MKKVGWQSIFPIFADVVISPWNLLVGGLLIKYLSASESFFAIIFGYLILTLIFYYYGGLGLTERKQSAQIFNDIFSSKIARYLVPSVLAIGQIGWASINIELGGKSLAHIFSMPFGLGIGLFAFLLILMGILDLFKMGIVKLLVIISSLSLLAYVFISKITHIVAFSDFITYQPLTKYSIFWGISIVVASLISFSTVTPDFFQNIKSKKDLLLSTLLGLYIPGVITTLLGSFLFFDKGNFDLIALLSTLTFATFPHILNVSTNTDGSIAIYTPGLKLQNMFNLNLTTGIILAGIISFALALFHVSSYLESWLKILSLLFPTLIGLVLAKLFIKNQIEEGIFKKQIILIYILSTIISLIITIYFPSVLFGLFIPLFILKSLVLAKNYSQ